MAWIESHQEVGDHPKTRKLAMILGIHIAQAVGHLHLLWHWALSYAPDGDLSKFDEYDIAIGARWDGDATTFVNSLVAAGYVDRNDDAFALHDWLEYAGKLLATRMARAEAGRKGAEARWKNRNGSPKPTDSDANGKPLAPDSTEPDLPNQPTEPTSPSTGVDEELRQRLQTEGFVDRDIAAALVMLEDRIRFGGSPVTNRLAWSRRVVSDLAARAASSNGGPTIAEIEGERFELRGDEWVLIDA